MNPLDPIVPLVYRGTIGRPKVVTRLAAGVARIGTFNNPSPHHQLCHSSLSPLLLSHSSLANSLAISTAMDAQVLSLN